MTDDTENQVETEQDSPETVELAREMGWKPETEWKGEPPKGGHLSATEYVRRGEKILPIVNARARKAEERARELEARLDRQEQEHAKNLSRIERVTAATLENQRLQITAQYAARKEAAVEIGDKDAYRQANKDEDEALKAIDERLKDDEGDKGKKDDKPRELPKEVKAVIDEWIGENSWFNTDEEMNVVANSRHMKILKEKPGLSLKDNLEEVREYVKKRFPEKFGDDVDGDEPPRRRGSPVEGGSRLNGGSGGSLWAKVPAADQKIAAQHLEWFLKPGETMEKDGSKAKQRWAEKYFEGEQS